LPSITQAKYTPTPQQLPKGALLVGILEIPTLRKDTIDMSKRAIHSDQEGEYEEALLLYTQCIEKLDILLAKDDNSYYQDLYNKKRQEYSERAKILRDRSALKN